MGGPGLCAGWPSRHADRAQPYRAEATGGIPVYVRKGTTNGSLRLSSNMRQPAWTDPGGLTKKVGRLVDQKGRRWANMAISSRMAWVGADAYARSMARFSRLIR
ncbi:hypothetical protein Adu01nite_88480 [Paractinoplanes durhamensis]|uniref:Uncharacterized protein n=1 Tax=Paractinoplanes durhamensis TaxID=113563 RepID=A0ABQ3ZCD4_9ACTN|nr:hypothetical protein Adu01nite_88480 [Actinoplanes durhamensis]